MYDLIIIGGGPAGIFAAISAKEKKTDIKILVLEKSQKLLHKVLISGGGRCNVTNGLLNPMDLDPKDLARNYPRGQKELLGPFHQFGPKETIGWFEKNSVKLKKEEDGRIFPQSNSSATIVDSLLLRAKLLNIEILKNQDIEKVYKENESFKVSTKDKTFIAKKLAITTGSSTKGFEIAKDLGHTIKKPIPSLFGFNISKFTLKDLSGIALLVELKIEGSKFSQKGDMLITHFGFSGPAILTLSSFAARYLFDKSYKAELIVNWLFDLSEDEIFKKLIDLKNTKSQKTLYSENLFHLPKNLWFAFLDFFDETFTKQLKDLPKKDLLILSKKLSSDSYTINGKTTNKKEFVTCGGITLKEVNFKTMESKICENLFFAGEILDIDGVTGGFNFQNAWTTAYILGQSI
ncbi:MAG: Ferredoxin--NADP reductase [Candidatus Anoxychlamydiales bacterium]|nr:Ferredoxin--NADP reductase [Candidatus Anoxychlamydiales bacterium]